MLYRGECMILYYFIANQILIFLLIKYSKQTIKKNIDISYTKAWLILRLVIKSNKKRSTNQQKKNRKSIKKTYKTVTKKNKRKIRSRNKSRIKKGERKQVKTILD